MNEASTALAESLRSELGGMAEALETCLQSLAAEAARQTAPNGTSPSLKTTKTAVGLYLSETIASRQPGPLIEYLRWLQSSAQRSHEDAEGLLIVLDCFERVLSEAFPEHAQGIREFMEGARAAARMNLEAHGMATQASTPLIPLAEAYLDALLATDRVRAVALIEEAVGGGMPIQDIYLHVFQATQYEIGRLWQINRISVAQEHFCTATTQLIMSRLYPQIFSSQRRGRRLVAACVSGELHELGIRMVADFFEMDGWDTYYLGAAASAAAILKAVETHNPHVVGLSATMGHHVKRLEKFIEEMRRHCDKKIKILVGGHPFRARMGLWREVGADGYAPDAQKAIDVATSLTEDAP